MKFKITCDNCDYVFLTEGESRQTVQCQCPHCGGQMKVRLPDAGGPQPSEEPERPDDAPAEPRRRTGCGIVVGVCLGLFILLLLAMVAYSLSRRESTQPVEDPYARIIDDSTYYNDGYVEEEEKPDTVERHVEQHKEERDTAHVGAELDIDPHERIEPHEFLNLTEPSATEPSEPTDNAAPAEKSEKNQNTN